MIMTQQQQMFQMRKCDKKFNAKNLISFLVLEMILFETLTDMIYGHFSQLRFSL